MATGLDAHVIEMMVVGLPGSGKSSFVRSIGHRLKASNGWISGHLSLDNDTQIRLVEPPQPSSFEYVWLRKVIDQARVDGFLVMCDSTRPEQFMEVVYLLHTIRAYHPNVPCVLAANKQDQPSAWTTQQLRVRLGIGGEIQILPCVANDPETAEMVVTELLKQIL
jgi:uncharacterized protein